MMLVMHGFIFSVHTLKEPQIVIDFVPLVLSRHAVIAERLSARLLILGETKFTSTHVVVTSSIEHS